MMIENENAVVLDDVKKLILEFCVLPQGKSEILQHINVEINQQNFSKFVIKLVDQRYIASSFLRKRNSINQKYIITKKGLNYLKAIA